MVSKLRIIWKQTVKAGMAANRAAWGQYKRSLARHVLAAHEQEDQAVAVARAMKRQRRPGQEEVAQLFARSVSFVSTAAPPEL